MQVDGGGGQFRDLVEVIVGQYGCADVVIMLELVVVYVVGVSVQVAGEVARADVLVSRVRRLGSRNVSSQKFRLAPLLKVCLGCRRENRPYLKAKPVLDKLYILKCASWDCIVCQEDDG